MSEETTSSEHDGAGIWRDPSGILALGEATSAHQVNRGHDMCITYCLGERRPVQRPRGARCPSCYGKIGIRDMHGEEITPAGTRFAWLTGAFLAGWTAAWREATIGMVCKPEGN